MSETTNSNARVRLKRVEVRNYQSVKCAIFNVIPGINDLAGIPAQGKSTIPQAIAELFIKGGVSSMPLRRGAGDGLIRAEMDDGSVIEKKITPKGAQPTRRTDAEMLGTARHETIHFLREAGLIRMRPIIMTTAAMVAGLLLGLAVSVVLVKVVNPQSFHWTMQLLLPWGELLALCAAYVQGGLVKALDFSGAVAEMAHFGLQPAAPFAAATIALEPTKLAKLCLAWRKPAPTRR